MTNQTFTASIETTDGRAFDYGFHLGTIEPVARDCARDLATLTWVRGQGSFIVRTIALKRNGHIVDVWDGSEWESDAAERWYYEDMAERERETAGALAAELIRLAQMERETDADIAARVIFERAR